MRRIDDILDEVCIHHPQAALEVLRQAYVYSAKNHAGQLRKSGEPYLIHPLEVAFHLARMGMDVASVATGLLHDTIEDTLATYEELRGVFGDEIATLVDGVTKLSQIRFHSDEHKQAENFRKMLVAMARDIRVIIIKLADRHHNMSTLQYMVADKQERIAKETMEIYAPLASRLGMYELKSELEDLSFRYLRPKEYSELSALIEQRFEQRDAYIKRIHADLNAGMAEEGISGDVQGRPKHLWSIFRKMQAQDIPLDNIYDLLALRIVVATLAECYGALGLVHRMWHPIPGRIKDYIAVPKPNGYQSLHTTVVGPEGERFEVQIRTREMHEIAEKGVAAHWKYKEGRRAEVKTEEQFKWLRELLEWRNVEDPHEFLDAVKWDLFSEEVFVFTPTGDVVSLRRGSTPVDFAYSIHSDLGNHCTGAKINGKIVPLRYELHNGDIVEILSSTNQHPSKDWLSFVKSSRAKAKIRSFIKQAERERSLELGHEFLEKELRKHDLSLTRLIKSGELLEKVKDGHFATIDELYISVGYGKTPPKSISALFVTQEKAEAPAQPDGVIEKLWKKVARRSSSGVKVQGIEDMLVRFGRCCNPLPGDHIVGFVTRGRGITIHTTTCSKTLEFDVVRRIDVTWDTTEKITRPISIKVKTIDQPGILATISQTFTNHGVNISSANCKVTSKNLALNTFDVAITDSNQLRKVVIELEALSGVISVERS